MILTGEASEKMYMSLFHPTKEEIQKRKEVMDNIDKNVTIIESNDGSGSFIAEVKYLDLSFLNNIKNEDNN